MLFYNVENERLTLYDVTSEFKFALVLQSGSTLKRAIRLDTPSSLHTSLSEPQPYKPST